MLQLLYAYGKREDITLVEAERDLMKSISKSTDLYYETLLLLTEIQHRAFMKIDAARNKRLASNIDLNPNTRFIENPILQAIPKNKKFQSYTNSNMISWNDSLETVVYFYNKLMESNIYQKYMSQKEVSYEEHKQLVIDLFSEIVIADDMFYQMLEEKSIFWNDDFELVLSIVHKTLKNIREDQSEEDSIFYPIYKPEEDSEFARMLMRKTILENETNLKLIDKFTYNWEIERISDTDKLIMSCAISELKNFPSIPIKVTLDEYIEISKSYSSPKSGAFINGVLDKAVSLLKDSDQLLKTGRGLMEDSY